VRKGDENMGEIWADSRKQDEVERQKENEKDGVRRLEIGQPSQVASMADQMPP
jgi:hypothetical protein